MAQKLDVKQFVAKDHYAYFDSFRAGVFYYTICKIESDISYLFQIPVEDIAGATVSAQEKSITVMRWIRKSIEDGTFIKYK